MAIIEILSADLKTRLELTRLVQSFGHEPSPAASPEDLGDLRKQGRGDALLLVEPDPGIGSEWLAKAADGLPAVVVLAEPTASRALARMNEGAADCLPPAPTREALRAALTRALQAHGVTALEDAAVPPAPKPPRRGLRGAALVAVIAAGFWALRSGPASIGLPYAHPTGLAYDGDRFWSADWYGQAVNAHVPGTFALDRTFPFPADQPVAVAWGDSLLWVATAGGTVSRRDPASAFREVGRSRLDGLVPAGLCHDGLYLWAADARRKELVRMLTDAELTVERKVAYPGGTPAALACGAGSFWTVDSDSGELLEHDLAEPGRVLTRRPLPFPGGGKTTGLAEAGRTLWAVGEGTDGRGRAWSVGP